MISSLKDGNGSLTHDSKQINTIMRQFYQKLYSLETSVLADSYHSFLKRIKLASLSEEQT